MVINKNIKKEILAIHEHDLEYFLNKLELLDEFNSAKLKCSMCGTIIVKENFGCIYPERGDIKFCCSKLDCLNKINL
jgi:hypothetical protein